MSAKKSTKGYFVGSVIDFLPKSLRKKSEKLKTNRQLFRNFNFQKNKPRNCSANKILEERGSRKVIAVRCNCGKKTYHPVSKGEVLWQQLISPKKLIIIMGEE